VTIVLHPAELGDVRATVTVNGDQTTVRLVATTAQGAAALKASLGDLQSGLGQNGQRSAVLLGDSSGSSGSKTGSGGSDGDPEESASSLPSIDDSDLVTTAATPTGAASSSHQLDLRL
jgi:flagellar hook-length control protein FliK